VNSSPDKYGAVFPLEGAHAVGVGAHGPARDLGQSDPEGGDAEGAEVLDHAQVVSVLGGNLTHLLENGQSRLVKPKSESLSNR
jgi:hypothetical protein